MVFDCSPTLATKYFEIKNIFVWNYKIKDYVTMEKSPIEKPILFNCHPFSLN